MRVAAIQEAASCGRRGESASPNKRVAGRQIGCKRERLADDVGVRPGSAERDVHAAIGDFYRTDVGAAGVGGIRCGVEFLP